MLAACTTCLPGGYQVVNSVHPGNSSLMLKGYLDLSGAANPTMSYQRLYGLSNNSTLYVETSTDGGFTWNPIGSETRSNATLLPPSNVWEQRMVNLPKAARVMVRFRVDTRSAGTTADGVYIADIQIQPN